MTAKTNYLKILQGNRVNRGLVWGILILGALLAFEIFNYSTTDFAMSDLLGDLRFAGIRWSTILALAFCGIDFAGIARLFTPEKGILDESSEVWYLFSAWLLAATMNALLTWWGVSIAIVNHNTLGNAVIPRETLLKVVPIFVAIMVWLIRVLIIGTFSVAGERIFSQDDSPNARRGLPIRPNYNRAPTRRQTATPRYRQPSRQRPAPQASFRASAKNNPRPEPSYQAASRNSDSRNREIRN
jgi:hypothetical protein